MADGVLPGGKISGYELYLDDGLGGNLDLVYSTRNLAPSIVEYLATNLLTAYPYKFKVIAYNYNGAGP